MTWWTPDSLAPVPRLGWIDRPTPVDALPAVAEELGFSWFGVKRDDQGPALKGGNKTRKLDVLLATEPFASSARWASVGAIGSGHLAAMTLAAAALGRTLEAHCFWEPVSASVLDNLACIASGPTELHYRSNRVSLGVFSTRVVRGLRDGPAPAIPPGGSVPEGVVGIVGGALELAAQIHADVLPRPDVIYLPWGTGGTAAGVALGMALAGLPTEVRAVATVEPWFVSKRPLVRLVDQTLALLATWGLTPPAGFRMPPVTPVRGYVGRGYGHVTPDSERAVEWLGASVPNAEPIYGGKALAALRREAPEQAGRNVLYWLTSHRGALPHDAGWRERLPPRLRRRLDRAQGDGVSRRRVLVGVGGAALLITGWRHLVGYGDFDDWDGRVLSRHEAHVVAAAAEAVIPDRPGPLPTPGPSAREVAEAVDRYLVGMPARMLLEVHGMVELLEQGTGLDLHVSRMTRLDPAARFRWLRRLDWYGGLLAQASRGIRDLCLLGWYQDARTWDALEFAGPIVPAEGLGEDAYARFVAAPGVDPRGATR